MRRIKVPIFRQTKNACGPTCLEMVLKYYGDDKSLREIAKGVGGIKRYGVKCIKMCEYARRLGYKVHCFSYNEKKAKGLAEIVKPNKELIIKYLKKGVPVILTVRAFILWGRKYSEMGHYIVITKYNKEFFWYNDPHFAKVFRIKEEDLLFAWHNNILENSGYMLVIEPRKRK